MILIKLNVQFYVSKIINDILCKINANEFKIKYLQNIFKKKLFYFWPYLKKNVLFFVSNFD